MTHFNHSPINIHYNNIKKSQYILGRQNNLKDIKSKATNHRETRLNQLADEEHILGNIKYVRYLRSIIKIEQQIVLNRKNNLSKR